MTVRSGRNTKDENLHYVMNYSEETKNLSCPWDQEEDLLTGDRFQKGDTLSISDWDLKILIEIENPHTF